MASFGYYALTFLESIPAIVGLRAGFEQPRYAVLATLGPDIEIRRYPARLAAETAPGIPANAAFGLLFAYITGANTDGEEIAMTAPVERGVALSMTTPVETGSGVMRFFLPGGVLRAPIPTDRRVSIVTVPERTLAVLRFSGQYGPEVLAGKRAQLAARLVGSRWRAEGAGGFFGYDPPFTLPPFRRNEVFTPVTDAPAP